MTSLSLTQRAERALLGALLLDPAGYPQQPAVEPGDFGSDLNRRVFERLRHDQQAVASVAPPGYLDLLRQSCPDPAHSPAYARLVIEASLRRHLAAHALRVQVAAAEVHHHGKRLAAGAQPGDGAETLLARDLLTADGHSSHPAVQRLLTHEFQVAVALHAHATAFDPDRAPAAAVPVPAVPEPAPPVLAMPSSASVAAWHDAADATHSWPLALEAREEHVLASIIQQHDASRTIPQWLPAAAMTGPRRELLAALKALTVRGDPVDEVTADWELARRRSLAGEPHGDTSYAARLAAVRVQASSAVAIAQALTRLPAMVPSVPGPREILPPPPTPRYDTGPQPQM